MTRKVPAQVREARRTIYLLGDAHLGAQSTAAEAEKFNRLVSFFHARRGDAESQIIIVGDLFDFWFEYRHVVARQHFRMLARLADLVESGMQVDYIAGNHDFWLGSFLEQEVGVSVHRDLLEVMQAGKRILLQHGDGLMQKDHLYRLMKRVLRHPLAVAAYRLLHPDLGIPFALYCSHLSRESARDEILDDTDYRTFACGKIDAGNDVVALGHSHVPALYRHNQGWYVNAGAWMSTYTYARIEAGVPALFQWDGKTGRPFAPLPEPKKQS